MAGCRTTAATASICFADIYLFICLFIQTLLRMHIISMSVIGMTVTTAPTPTPFTNTLCVGTIFILLNNRNNKYRKKRQRQRQRQRRRRRRKYSSISCLKCVFDVTMMFGWFVFEFADLHRILSNVSRECIYTSVAHIYIINIFNCLDVK